MKSWLTVLAGAGLLAGCGGDPAGRDASDDRKAEGEVLGGSISDAMIPLEQVKSQSPAQTPVAASADGSGEEGDEAEGGEGDLPVDGAESPAQPAPSTPVADPAQ
ncbi:MAG: hypothetical protein A3J40_00400 [Erythrobacter sp. RIFCSPHIGHO2_12_FULL_63_10]|nr:MAG: hypothetical protein A3J40_00400 [Erythrobacter sp. RIFCSPHIGHO2_12_FULL_63_10]